ncbi:capsid maturation protease [Arthrobacter phage Jinkies]|uniref:Capsid maturation protease n=1 Tax=Arthrobacter phage Jinkies TaxID=2743903 RepID=A0A7S6BFK1_9CAUD|nr:capsid maturation protease [Arthrobacter phage Jinkies]
MCRRCTALETDVTAQVMLAAAERELILAQTDAGESVPHATRPLSAAEKRAKMRFKEIDDLQVSATEKAAKLLASNAQVYIMAVISAIFGTETELSPAQTVAAFEALARGEMPARAAAAADTLTDSIARILAQVYAGASVIAIGEAKRQGGKGLPDPLEADADRFRPHARAVSLYAWTRLTTKLQADMLTPKNLATPFKRADAEAAAKAIPLDGAADLAKQAVHTAHGQGRLDTMQPLSPVEIFSSELLDGETCGPCSRVDGKEYATFAEARVEYEAGGYGGCLGGSRCRGSICCIY